jgi:hypothetical protein
MQIAIVDRNPFVARPVQHLLEQNGYRATIRNGREPELVLPQGGLVPDLILIGQRSSEDCRWPCFNRWQESAPGQPLMLYVLDDCQPGRMAVLLQAVHQAETDLARTPRRDTSASPTGTPQKGKDAIHVQFRK